VGKKRSIWNNPHGTLTGEREKDGEEKRSGHTFGLNR
jgi:hypothetical protein